MGRRDPCHRRAGRVLHESRESGEPESGRLRVRAAGSCVRALETQRRSERLKNVVARNEAVGPVDTEADFFYVPRIFPCGSTLLGTLMRATAGVASTPEGGASRHVRRASRLRGDPPMKLNIET